MLYWNLAGDQSSSILSSSILSTFNGIIMVHHYIMVNGLLVPGIVVISEERYL